MTPEVSLENEVYVEYLLKYLSVLQEGRVKPNSRNDGGGVIRDSIDNYGDIYIVKCKLNDIFNLEQDNIDLFNHKKKIFDEQGQKITK
jgi:hypothetical protein